MQAQGRRTQPEVPASNPRAEAGSSYRFLVRSAEEAVGAIRRELGDEARVVSVRAVKAGGFSGLLGGTRLEVIAQTPPRGVVPVEAASMSGSVEPVTTVPQAAPVRRNGDHLTAAAYAAATTPVEATPASAQAPRAEESVSLRRRAAPPPQRLEGLLRRSGLSESLIARLQSTAEWPAGEDRPLHEGFAQVAGQIRQLAAGVPTRPLPGRAAFVGLPGSGRTTALCKWLSAEVFTRGRHGAVASVEFDRPQGTEQLAVFAEMLGVEFSRQAPAAGGETGGRFCYLDTPPMSLTRPEENTRLRGYLDEQKVSGRVLVVSALLDGTLLRLACAAGVEIGCTHIVFTQLDELPQWGKLWDFLIEAPLAPLLATLGPSLSAECETDVVGAVLRRTFPWN